MDEMMRQAGPPPPPPPAHHSLPVPRTVVAATTAPLSPPLLPSGQNHVQVPSWHGQDQAEMMRPDARYGEAVNPTPYYHFSPQASAASHGSSGGLYHETTQHHQQQQQSPVTHSVISTSSAADGSSSISISSSGDMSHPPSGPLLPTKEEETMRQITLNSTIFAPIQNGVDGSDGSSRAYRAVDDASVPQANALARVAVQSVPVSPPRQQRNDTYNNKMTLLPRKQKVDTSLSPLRKASNVSCRPAVQVKNSLPQKTKATKKTKPAANRRTPKSKDCSSPSSSTTKPSATNTCGKESPLQGELEAASLLANMFAA